MATFKTRQMESRDKNYAEEMRYDQAKAVEAKLLEGEVKEATRFDLSRF